MKPIISLLVGAVFFAAGSAGAHAQAARLASAGVYTAAQAARGLTLYKSRCAECHGPDLSGGGTAPALIGPDFMASWSSKPVEALFHAIKTSMPSDHPGTLTAQQTADLISFFLKVNGFPAGDAELPAAGSRLKSILLDSAP